MFYIYELNLLNFLLQTFRSYLSYQRDNNELVYYILRGLVLEAIGYKRGNQEQFQTVTIEERDLLRKVSFLVYILCIKCF